MKNPGIEAELSLCRTGWWLQSKLLPSFSAAKSALTRAPTLERFLNPPRGIPGRLNSKLLEVKTEGPARRCSKGGSKSRLETQTGSPAHLLTFLPHMGRSLGPGMAGITRTTTRGP